MPSQGPLPGASEAKAAPSEQPVHFEPSGRATAIGGLEQATQLVNVQLAAIESGLEHK